MGTTQPIRNRKELQKFSTYYQTVKPHPRNYALIILGLNTALRISDLLQLQWSDVYDFYTQRFREHLLFQSVVLPGERDTLEFQFPALDRIEGKAGAE